MRKIRDALVHSIDQRLSSRKVGQIIGIHPSTVCNYLDRFKASGLAWPLSEELDDAALEKNFSHVMWFEAMPPKTTSILLMFIASCRSVEPREPCSIQSGWSKPP
ncbi:helix-turn-helix domain-containing protein (plasmid) [Pseudomonas shirazica]|nr:helix-turn-helix domain-containing protein [Pseudomonas shirazica]